MAALLFCLTAIQPAAAYTSNNPADNSGGGASPEDYLFATGTTTAQKIFHLPASGPPTAGATLHVTMRLNAQPPAFWTCTSALALTYTIASNRGSFPVTPGCGTGIPLKLAYDSYAITIPQTDLPNDGAAQDITITAKYAGPLPVVGQLTDMAIQTGSNQNSAYSTAPAQDGELVWTLDMPASLPAPSTPAVSPDPEPGKITYHVSQGTGVTPDTYRVQDGSGNYLDTIQGSQGTYEEDGFQPGQTATAVITPITHGVSGPPLTVSARPPSTPVTQLSATPSGIGALTLQFSATADAGTGTSPAHTYDATEFQLDWAPDGQTWTLLAVVQPSTNSQPPSNSYQHSPLSQGALIWYRARAENTVGWGPYAFATATVTPPPPPPISVTAVQDGAGTAKVAWSAPCSPCSPSIGSYELWRSASTSPGFQVLSSSISASAVYYVDTPVTSGVTYSYYMQAHTTTGGWSSPSNVASVQIDPPHPLGVDVQSVCGGAGGPDLYGDTEEVNPQIPSGVTMSSTTYLESANANGASPQTISPANYNQDYYGYVTTMDHSAVTSQTLYFQVQATDTHGQAYQSAWAAGNTLYMPSAPTSFQVNPGPHAGHVTLSWAPPTDNGGSAITGYYYQQTSPSAGGMVLVGDASTRSVELPISGATTFILEASTCLTTQGAGDLGGIAATATGSPPTAPGTPDPPTFASGPGAHTVTLQWSPPANGGCAISSYDVQRTIGSNVQQIPAANALVLPDAALAGGATASYQVRATNCVGTGSWSTITSATASASVPDPPVLSAQMDAGPGAIDTSWTPGGTGGSAITSYTLLASPNNVQPFTEVKTDGATFTTFTDRGLPAGTTMYYQVRANNGVGPGALSNVASATTMTFPTAPLNLLVARGDRQLVLIWNPPASAGGGHILRYNLVGHVGGAPDQNITTIPSGTTTYTHSGLHYGERWYYSLVAENEVGESRTPATGTAITYGVPTTPLNVTSASGPLRGQIQVYWSRPTDSNGYAITNYTVHRGVTVTAITQAIANITATAQNNYTYLDAGLTADQTYYYQITAHNQAGDSNRSLVTANLPPGRPSPPRDLSAQRSGTAILLTWIPPAWNGGFALQNYTLYESTDKGATYASFAKTAPNATTFTANLCVPATCLFRATATNAFGESDPSNAAGLRAASFPPESIRGTTPGAGGLIRSPLPCTQVRQGSINLVTGQYVATVCLSDLPSSYPDLDVPIQVTHRSATGDSAFAGQNWFLSLARQALRTPGGVLVSDGSGRQDLYTPTGNGFTSPPGFYDRLTNGANGALILEHVGGTKETFDAHGYRVAVQDVMGNNVTFWNDPVGKPYQVRDAHGRITLFEYSSRNLTRIRDWTGRDTTITYANGDLHSITYPANATGQRATITFTYTRQHDLQSATNAAGAAYLQNDYDASERVQNQTYGDGRWHISYNRTLSQTSVTDRDGNNVTWTYVSPSWPVPKKKQEFSNNNVRPGDATSYTTKYAFARNLELTQLTLPSGLNENWTYDLFNANPIAHGNLLQQSVTPTSGAPVTTSYTYEPLYQGLRSETSPNGNNASYTPQNGGTATSQRYTTYYYYGQDETTDLNGDGVTGAPIGRVVLIQHPSVNTHGVPDSNMQAASGNQARLECFQYNARGQVTRHIDVDGSTTDYAYYAGGDATQAPGLLQTESRETLPHATTCGTQPTPPRHRVMGPLGPLSPITITAGTGQLINNVASIVSPTPPTFQVCSPGGINVVFPWTINTNTGPAGFWRSVVFAITVSEGATQIGTDNHPEGWTTVAYAASSGAATTPTVFIPASTTPQAYLVNMQVAFILSAPPTPTTSTANANVVIATTCLSPDCPSPLTGSAPSCTLPPQPCPGGLPGNLPTCGCPPPLIGTMPSCTAPPQNCPAPYGGQAPSCTCPASDSGAFPSCIPPCPSGTTGSFPNCTVPCPSPTTGTLPSCTPPPQACPSPFGGMMPSCTCPATYAGSFPSCEPPCQSPFTGNLPSCGCPATYTGSFPACVPPPVPCPAGMMGNVPNCTANCPSPSAGVAPNCVTPCPAPLFNGGEIYPNGSNTCTASCPPGSIGNVPSCTTPCPAPIFNGGQILPNGSNTCTAPCPPGSTGNVPNCTTPCPSGSTGILPTCVAPCPTPFNGGHIGSDGTDTCTLSCPSGSTGNVPNCVTPCPAPLTGSITGATQNCGCPSTYTGTFPACEPPCPPQAPGTFPACTPPCPTGTTGTPPHCSMACPPPLFNGGQISSDGTNSCTIPCPTGTTGNVPTCTAPCPAPLTGSITGATQNCGCPATYSGSFPACEPPCPPQAPGTFPACTPPCPTGTTGTPPHCLMACPPPLFNGGQIGSDGTNSCTIPCPAGTTGNLPNCSTPCPSPLTGSITGATQNCGCPTTYTGTFPACEPPCPPQAPGAFPACTPPCPTGTTGTPPNCSMPCPPPFNGGQIHSDGSNSCTAPCPSGSTGTIPNCTTTCPTPFTGTITGATESCGCPATYAGSFPVCEPPCPSQAPGSFPVCIAPPTPCPAPFTGGSIYYDGTPPSCARTCPSGSGNVPACTTPCPPPIFDSGQINPDGSNSCTVPCPSGSTGELPNCTTPCPSPVFNGGQINPDGSNSCTMPCPSGSTGNLPACTTPCPAPAFNGGQVNPDGSNTCTAPCPAGSTGTVPTCTTPCPAPVFNGGQIHSDGTNSCTAPCPPGSTGNIPNCVTPCPSGSTGNLPTCTAPCPAPIFNGGQIHSDGSNTCTISCPSGSTGNLPNCVTPCPSPLTGSITGATQNCGCPSTYTGTFPACEPPCPPQAPGVFPTCTPPCPTGTTGTPPNCSMPCPPPIFNGGQIHSDGSNSCTAPCPSGSTGTIPNCTTACPTPFTGTITGATESCGCPGTYSGSFPGCEPPCPANAPGTFPSCVPPPTPCPQPFTGGSVYYDAKTLPTCVVACPSGSTGNLPACTTPCPPPVFNGGQINPDGSNTCTAPCPSGSTGNVPACTTPCPSIVFNGGQINPNGSNSCTVSCPAGSTGNLPSCTTPCPRPVFDGGQVNPDGTNSCTASCPSGSTGELPNCTTPCPVGAGTLPACTQACPGPVFSGGAINPDGSNSCVAPCPSPLTGSAPACGCPPADPGSFPQCVSPPTPCPAPFTAGSIYYDGHTPPSCSAPCPSGSTGTLPNCTTPCPTWSGNLPTCTQPCPPPAFSGGQINPDGSNTCVAPCPSPFTGAAPACGCPPADAGSFPQCVPPPTPCPAPFADGFVYYDGSTPPSCGEACPSGSGDVPNCVTPCPAPLFNGGQVNPDGTNTCTVSCPAGFAGNVPNCVMPCPPPFTGVAPYCAPPPQPCPSPYTGSIPDCSCPASYSGAFPACSPPPQPCPAPVFNGGQVNPDGSNTCTASCPAGSTGNVPDCVMPCPPPFTGTAPNCNPPPPPACPSPLKGIAPNCVAPPLSLPGQTLPPRPRLPPPTGSSPPPATLPGALAKTTAANLSALCACDPNATLSFTYDEAGNVASATDGLGHTTTYTTDNLGHRTSITAPGGLGQVTTAYDLDGNLIRTRTQNVATLPSGVVAVDASHPWFQDAMAYDALGHKVESWTDETPARSNVTKLVHEKFGYDKNENLVLVRHAASTNGSIPEDVASYVYDERGHLVTSTMGGRTAQFIALGANSKVDVHDIQAPVTLFLRSNPAALPVGTSPIAGTPYGYYLDGGPVTGTTPKIAAPLPPIPPLTDPTGVVGSLDLNPLVAPATGPVNQNWTWSPAGGFNLPASRAQVVLYAVQLDSPAPTSNTWQATLAVDGHKVGVASRNFPAAAPGQVTEYRLSFPTMSLHGTSLTVNVQPVGAVGRVLEFDAASAPSRVEIGNAATTTTDYNSDGNPSTSTDAMGYKTTHTYDSHDREVATTDESGSATTRQFDDAGHVTVESQVGALNGLGWSHRATSTVLLSQTVQSYDEAGQLWRQQKRLFDPATAKALPNAGIHPNSGNTTTIMEYDAAGRLVRQTDDNGRAHTYTYNGEGELVQEGDAAGTMATYCYDAAQNLVKRTVSTVNGANATSYPTLFSYDAENRVTRTVDAVGQTHRAGYDSRGNLAWETDARGPLASDPEARFAGQINGAGNLVTYQYDAAGRLTSTNRTLTSTGQGDGAATGSIITRQAWNDDGKLVSQTDAQGQATRYAYDQLGNLVSQSYADGSVESYGYDYNSNLVKVAEPSGFVVGQDFDVENHLVHRGLTTGSGPSNDQRFEYDGMGRVTSAYDNNDQAAWSLAPGLLSTPNQDAVWSNFTYDSLGRAMNQSQTHYDLNAVGNARPVTATVSNAYDGVGNAIQLTYPNGRVVSKGYDAINRLSSAVDSTSFIAGFTYDSAKLLSRVNGNGVITTYTYDADGRITGISAGVSSSAFASTYQYDRNNERISEARAQAPELSQQVTYDSVGRLTSLSRSNFAGLTMPAFASLTNPLATSVTWSLDGANNWGSLVATQGGVTTTQNRTSSATNNVKTETVGASTTTFTYDPNGNRLGDAKYTYTWDAYNRLRSVTDKATGVLLARYAYDALNRRVAKCCLPAVGPPLPPIPLLTWYAYDGANVIEERDGTNQVLRQYAFGDQVDDPLAIDHQTPAGWQRLYYEQDANGDVTALTNSNAAIVEGYLYEAYGKPVIVTPGPNGRVDWGNDDVTATASAVDNPYLYTGQRYDADTGLYYYRARYYDSEAGQFLSRDPIGGWSDLLNVGNAYGYVGENPVSLWDPYGLCGGWCWFGLGAVVVASVAATILTVGAAGPELAVADAGIIGAEVGSQIAVEGSLEAGAEVASEATAESEATAQTGASNLAKFARWFIKGPAANTAVHGLADCLVHKLQCGRDSWESYVGAGVTGGTFEGATALLELKLMGRIAWGATSGLSGDALDQWLSQAAGDQCGWNLGKMVADFGLGAVGGGLSKIPGVNLGASNYWGRFLSVLNSGRSFGTASYRNFAVGGVAPIFLMGTPVDAMGTTLGAMGGHGRC
ncbi:MAG: RHS repeat-associated core domain-containing protein [Thermoplasmatota archaeon]